MAQCYLDNLIPTYKIPDGKHRRGELERAILRQEEENIFSLAATREDLDPLVIGGTMVTFRNMRMDPRGRSVTPLLVAVHFQEREILKHLVAEGADLNAGYLHNTRPLGLALDYKHFDIAKLLIRSGADVNFVDLDGKTPLHRALEESEDQREVKETETVDIVVALLEAGARAPATDQEGRSALHVAAGFGALHVCKALLKGGACYNLKSRKGTTPQTAAEANLQREGSAVDVVKLLREIARFFKLIRRKDGKIVAELEKVSSSEDLLCFINCVNRNGNTLMGEALEIGCKDVAEVIMKLRVKTTLE